jgi:hypothetical protein
MGLTVIIRASKDAKYHQVAKVVKLLGARKATKVDMEVNDDLGITIAAWRFEPAARLLTVSFSRPCRH